LGSRRAAAYRISARAPTRSPQGGRARQNAAKNPADLHAGRFARASGHRPAWRASAPRASSTRSPPSTPQACWRGEDSRPLRRPRPAASAAGPWPKRGRLSPSDAKRSEGQRSGAAAPRVWGKGRAWGVARHGGERQDRQEGGRRARGKVERTGGLEEGGRKGGRPRKGGSDCNQYRVMFYCGPRRRF
jgi:hypothetical protein